MHLELHGFIRFFFKKKMRTFRVFVEGEVWSSDRGDFLGITG